MCCSRYLKTIMFISTGTIFAVGAAILGVGIWVTVDADSLLDFLDAPPELVGYLLIGLGLVLTFIGFLGCCGAVRESRYMLLTFFIIILLIFIAEVAGGIWLLVSRAGVKKLLEDINEKVVVSLKEHYGGPDDEAFTTSWNTTMDTLECCGYNNYTDFYGSPHVNMTDLYPIECCKEGTYCDVVRAAVDANSGCLPKLETLIKDNALMGAVALGVCGFEIAALVMSMVLYTKVGQSD
ncbi:tetraspanin-1-like [Engraulis encrasicolus]|uniref:tetraspanin-1-like n=1 Tax=Engraulis encrasicolus TaxID=184585 RepID=UPI002FCF151A